MRGRCRQDSGLLVAILLPMLVPRAPLVAQTGVGSPATAVLEGRVVDMRGEGLPNAEVWVVPFDPADKRSWRSRTDGDGVWRLGSLPGGDVWRLYARAEGHCCVGHFLRAPLVPMEIVLHEAATVRGVLWDARGAPVAGAKVFAKAATRPSEAVADGVTDAAGRFTVAGVPLGRNRFAAWIEGEGLVTAEMHVTGDAEVHLVPVGGDTTALHITMRGASAAECARVSLSLTGNAPTGSYGGRPECPAPFFVRGVPATGLDLGPLPDWKEWIVQPYAPGIRFQPSGSTVSGKGPHTVEFVAKVPAPSPTTVRARVRDTDGKAVAALAVGYYGTSYSPRIAATSDADGALAIESPWAVEQATVVSAADRWLLRLRGAGTDAARSVQPANAQTEGIDLEAVPASSITGRVLRPDGSPAVAAPVRLQRLDLHGTGRTWVAVDTAWTGRDGAFALRQLAIATADLRLAIEGADGRCVREGIDLQRRGTELRLGELRLEPAATVEGVVRTSTGDPAVGLRVDLRVADPADPTCQLHGALVVTDARGRYRFRGVPAGSGTLQLWTAQAGVEPPEPPFQVENGQTCTVPLVEHAR